MVARRLRRRLNGVKPEARLGFANFVRGVDVEADSRSRSACVYALPRNSMYMSALQGSQSCAFRAEKLTGP